MIPDFNFASTPHLYFGAGKRNVLSDVVRTYGSKILLITGGHSLQSSTQGKQLLDKLYSEFSVEHYIIDKEPTPTLIDGGAAENRLKNIHVVVAIGGGSVLDAGKAISAMLTVDDSVKSFLEGVGTKNHPGSKVPFVAMPTTAGTGSEATKNAVVYEVVVS
jgi:alcohol dehydrogenase class IV